MSIIGSLGIVVPRMGRSRAWHNYQRDLGSHYALVHRQMEDIEKSLGTAGLRRGSRPTRYNGKDAQP